MKLSRRLSSSPRSPCGALWRDDPPAVRRGDDAGRAARRSGAAPTRARPAPAPRARRAAGAVSGRARGDRAPMTATDPGPRRSDEGRSRPACRPKARAASSQAVPIKGFVFSRPRDRDEGDTVTWTNEDAAPRRDRVRRELDTGSLEKAGAGSARLLELGLIRLHLCIHPNMKGTVIVKAACSGRRGRRGARLGAPARAPPVPRACWTPGLTTSSASDWLGLLGLADTSANAAVMAGSSACCSSGPARSRGASAATSRLRLPSESRRRGRGRKRAPWRSAAAGAGCRPKAPRHLECGVEERGRVWICPRPGPISPWPPP